MNTGAGGGNARGRSCGAQLSVGARWVLGWGVSRYVHASSACGRAAFQSFLLADGLPVGAAAAALVASARKGAHGVCHCRHVHGPRTVARLQRLVCSLQVGGQSLQRLCGACAVRHGRRHALPLPAGQRQPALPSGRGRRGGGAPPCRRAVMHRGMLKGQAKPVHERHSSSPRGFSAPPAPLVSTSHAAWSAARTTAGLGGLSGCTPDGFVGARPLGLDGGTAGWAFVRARCQREP